MNAINNAIITNTTTLPPSVDVAAPNPLPLPPEVVQGSAIRDVYIWVLLAVGLPGNVVCVVVIIATMMFNSAISYVAVLAVADSLALLTKVLFHQLITHGKMTSSACIFYLAPPFLSCYANWVLVLICFERFITVCFPWRKDAWFSRVRVVLSIILLALALGACFAPALFFQGIPHASGKRCLFDENWENLYEDFYEVFFACLYFFAPFLLIVLFTILIIIGLLLHRRARQRSGVLRKEGIRGAAADVDSCAKDHSGGGGGGGGGGGNDGGGGGSGGVELSISIMLVCAGLVFLLLTLPACLYHLFLEKMFNFSKTDSKARAFLLYQVVTMLSDTSHAVNFIIYFLSSSFFRKKSIEALRRYCSCCRSLPWPWDASSHSDFSSREALGLTVLSQSQESKSLTADKTTPLSARSIEH